MRASASRGVFAWTRRHRTVVPGIHRLQHVERLAAAALADDDPVGPHAQRILHEVADANHGAAALDIRRTRFEPDDVLLVEQEFRRVLDRHDALAVRECSSKGC